MNAMGIVGVPVGASPSQRQELKSSGATINAVPFPAYAVANPSHYRLGIYNGLSITFTPLAGFRSITVYINVTDFVG